MNENIEMAFQSLQNCEDAKEKEVAAIQLINSVLNSLEGYGAYTVLCSTLAGFTGVQPIPWQSLSFVIQGVLQGWNNIQAQTEKPEGTIH